MEAGEVLAEFDETYATRCRDFRIPPAVESASPSPRALKSVVIAKKEEANDDAKGNR